MVADYLASHMLTPGPVFSRLDRLLPIGPTPKGASRYTHTLALSIEAVCVMPVRGWQYFWSVGPFDNENESELRRF